MKMKWLFCFLLALLTPLVQAKAVGIFNGSGTCKGCAETVGRFFTQRGDHVVYLNEKTLSVASLRRLQVYVQPGGSDDIDDTLNTQLPTQIKAIRAFVADGGSYLGICAGAYLAARYSSVAQKKPAYGLIPLDELDPEVPDPAPSLLNVRWGEQERWIYNQSGAHFGTKAAPGIQVLARYSASGHIAALRTPFGKGKVVLTGPHLEADETWYAEDGLSLQHGLNHDLFKALLKSL